MTTNEPASADFAALLRRNAEKAYNFAYRLAGNEQDARDLVQEAFAHALKNFSRYDQTRPFEPWLNRILKNIFLDSMRRYEQKHAVSLDGPSPVEDITWERMLPGRDPSPLEEVDRWETSRLVQQALNSLPVLYKTAIVLCDVERYSYEKIGEILGCPIGTVRSRIHQGRLLLKQAFERLQSGVQSLEVL